MDGQIRILRLDVARERLSVRISEQHRQHLNRLRDLTGMTLTAAVEMAITHTLRSIERGDPIYHSAPPEKPQDGHKSA